MTVEKIEHTFSPTDEDAEILHYHRKIRCELCEKINAEIIKSAFIADNEKGAHYRSYYNEIVVSSATLLIINSAIEMKYDINDFSSVLITLIYKIMKFINSLETYESLKDIKFLETFCKNIIKSKDFIYEKASHPFEYHDIQ